eukprot:3161740-Alexandrium_andersonii.AAC.1
MTLGEGECGELATGKFWRSIPANHGIAASLVRWTCQAATAAGLTRHRPTLTACDALLSVSPLRLWLPQGSRST